MLKVINAFMDLGLNKYIINVLNEIGYKAPLPIQAQCIPYLLSGRDVLGMAHTGSGKTAAFVLPMLHNIDIDIAFSQGLIIAPTRELAIQIGKVCINLSKYMRTINVAILYGGQSYDIQLRILKKNPHIIVGTPGRLLDHLNRGTANLSKLKILVIDEADEMLRMGFIEDVKKIIENIPVKHQTALFSATLPVSIRRISHQFMCNPKEVYINSGTNVCSDIAQNYWLVCGIAKHEALMRFLEIENFDAAIVFVRTKYATLEISGILEKFGYNSAALNGDMNQMLRHQTLDRLRDGRLDILIATDIAARGLDVHRISLVINYDIPINSDAYVHRIGRTGRAGCIGKSVLFVERHEYRLLRNIERSINLSIPEIQYPTAKILESCRLVKFSNKIERQLSSNDLGVYRALLSKIRPNQDVTIENLAAVLLKMAQGNRPLVLPPDPSVKSRLFYNKNKLCYNKKSQRRNYKSNNGSVRVAWNFKDSNTSLYRISIGSDDGITIKHIIKVLVSNANIHHHDIGNIQLFSSYSIIELTKEVSSHKILVQLSRVRILDKLINIKLLHGSAFKSKKKNYCDQPVSTIIENKFNTSTLY